VPQSCHNSPLTFGKTKTGAAPMRPFLALITLLSLTACGGIPIVPLI